MSKTTISLLIILFVFIGILVYVTYGVKQNALITSITQSFHLQTNAITNTTLSISTTESTIHPGQTATVAILIHNPNPHPSLAQLEVAYDPTVLTINSITPGDFFINPTIALENIDPTSGRISYALRCLGNQMTNTLTDCVNKTSSTLAVISYTVNGYALKNTTILSFLPKTVVRIGNGRDILKETKPLQLTIAQPLYRVATSSAIGSPGANLIHITPVH